MRINDKEPAAILLDKEFAAGFLKKFANRELCKPKPL